MPKITDIMLRNAQPGSKPIGDDATTGLRFEPGNAKGHGKWTLRFVSPITKKRRDFGLGAYPAVGVADARLRALEAHRTISAGRDPVEEKQASRARVKAASDALTFEVAARRAHEAKETGWRSDKHKAQWINTLSTYVFPKIGKQKVSELQPSDFAEALRAIWLKKPETASRVKQRCHTVMKWCWAQGHVNSNPVDIIDDLLPKQPSKRERVKHHPSMAWRDVPAFVQNTVRTGEPNATRALLEFVILTAARSGEARAMHWEEVDLARRVWTVPAERMKARVIHRVPLSERVMEILQQQRQLHPDSDLVFPSPRGGVMSDMSLTTYLRDQKAPSSDPNEIATAHGFRSSFRDWCSESGISRDLAERALAHTVKNPAEAAYHRTDLLEQRRPVMEAWSHHICGAVTSGNVISLHQ